MSSLEQTVGEIAAAHPRSIRVFERLGIDYCCGGRQTLAEACALKKISTGEALDLLEGAEAAGPGAEDEIETWNVAPLPALTAHIVGTHHRFVREETARLVGLFRKVVQRHGHAQPQVQQMEALFLAMGQELAMHMLKEEQILFPVVDRMERASKEQAEMPEAYRGLVSRPIVEMLAEHDDAGALLDRLREISAGYTLPPGACATFRALYAGLQEFEKDMHRHVHLENNILFPRAIALEQGLTERAGRTAIATDKTKELP